MRLRKYWMLATIVSMLLIFLSGNVFAYNMTEYIPLNQGDQWIYSMSMTVEGGEAEGEYGPMLSKIVVNGTEVVNEVETVKLEMRTPASSKTADYYCYTFDSEGLKEYKEHVVNYIGVISVFEEGVLLIPAQFNLGEVNQQSWSINNFDADDNFIGTDTGNYTSSIESMEDVSTPAGTFNNCLKIDVTITNDSLTWENKSNYWRARDVGVVKMSITDYFNTPEEGEVLITMEYELVGATVSGVSYGQCPAVFALGGDARGEDLNTLRKFRDEVLNKTAEGQQIIKFYYQLGPTIVQAMATDKELKKEIKEVIDLILPFLR
jgi:hypothetical protein